MIVAFWLVACGPHGSTAGSCGTYAIVAPTSGVDERDLDERCSADDGTVAAESLDAGLTTLSFAPDSDGATPRIVADFANDQLVDGNTITLFAADHGRACLGDACDDAADLAGGSIGVEKAGPSGVTTKDGAIVDYWKLSWDVTWGDPSTDGPWYTAQGEDWVAVRIESSTVGGGGDGGYYYYYYYYYYY